jgi:ribosomal protein S18 acetylase RimI-like enzyme
MAMDTCGIAPLLFKERIVEVTRTTLDRVEDYCDAVPRGACRVEEHGPPTLFVNRGAGWPYYARPRRGWPRRVTADDVRTVRARQRALGVPEALEWVAEVSPALRGAAEGAGLHVHEHPLLALDRPAFLPAAPPPGMTIGLVAAGAADLAAVRSVASLAFAEPGTAVGRAGRSELVVAAAAVPAASIADLRERLGLGLTVIVAARDAGGPLAVGSHQPVGAVTEVAGVGTLPAARRQGLAAAVTTELVRDAFGRGADVVFLSAAEEDVARIYRRLGFRRIATALIAEPPPPGA